MTLNEALQRPQSSQPSSGRFWHGLLLGGFQEHSAWSLRMNKHQAWVAIPKGLQVSYFYVLIHDCFTPVWYLTAFTIVEDRRKGYPRFSALMAGHSSFQIYRRFSDLRTRLLLLTQDEIVELEEQLNQIDQAEKSALFLASRREDRNSDRSVITTKLRSALSTYGKDITYLPWKSIG